MISADGSTRIAWRLRALVISLIAVTLLFPDSVQAGKMLHASAIPAGQVIDNDVFLTGQTPVVNGTVNGDVFIIGSNVTVSGEVNGSVFVLAESLKLAGQVNGNLFATTVELTQPAGGRITRSLYALALSLITEPESSIGRNLTTVAMSASLQGQTTGDTTAIIGPWELFKQLRNGIDQSIRGAAPGRQALAKSASENVATHARSPGQALAKSGLEYISFRANSPQRALLRAGRVADETSSPVDWLLTAVRSLLKFLIVGGLILWAFPRQFQDWVGRVQREPLASAGYGALVLINGYLIPVLILCLLVGLLLGLIYLSLPSLAWMSFWAGLGILVTIFTLFQAAATFLSKAIVAYLVGTFILSRVASSALRYPILALLLGLVIYVLLASIPYIGIFLGLVVTLLGLGAIWLARKQAPQAGVELVEAVQA